MDTSQGIIILLLLIILGIIIAILLKSYNLVHKTRYDLSSIFKEPYNYSDVGCDTMEDEACTEASRDGPCPATTMLNGKKISCTACSSYSGSDCVPTSCAKTACY